MLQNIGLLSLFSASPPVLLEGQNGAVQNLDETFGGRFNQLLYNNLLPGTSGEFELGGETNTTRLPELNGGKTNQAITQSVTAFAQALSASGALPAGGSELPKGGKVLPALVKKIQSLTQITAAMQQEIASQPALAKTPVALQVGAALNELVQKLERFTVTPDPALNPLAEADAAAEPGEQIGAIPFDQSLLDAVKTTIAQLRELAANLNPDQLRRPDNLSGLIEAPVSNDNLKGIGANKAEDIKNPVTQSMAGLTAGVKPNTLLQAIVQQAQSITVALEQTVAGAAQANNAAIVSPASSANDILLRNYYAANTAQPLVMGVQTPIIATLPGSLNAAQSTVTLAAITGKTVRTDALPDAAQLIAKASNMAAPVTQQAMASATNPAGSALVDQPFTAQIGLPLNHDRWGDQFAQRVAWLAGQGLKSAQIHLNPAELGPLQVRIESHDDSAKVVFTTSHVTTRDNIEANLPRLRDLFSAQGLDLLDVDVEQHNPHAHDQSLADEGNQEQQISDRADANIALADEVQQDSTTQHTVQLHYGLIDAFA